jgi:hypothetical protein
MNTYKTHDRILGQATTPIPHKNASHISFLCANHKASASDAARVSLFDRWLMLFLVHHIFLHPVTNTQIH